MAGIGFEVHFDIDLAEADVCDRLQAWLCDRSPRFASGLRVLAYERDPDAVGVEVSDSSSLKRAVLDRGMQRGSTFQALSADAPAAPFPRRFGGVVIRGKASRSFLGVAFDQLHPGMPMGDRWLFSNSLTGRIGASSIDGVPAASWVRALVEAFAGHPALLWAAAWSVDEWHDRNMHDGPDGMWALGRDIRRSLPGLFWLNVFGRPYVDHIGRARLLTVPTGRASEFGDAVLVRLYDSPEEWTEHDRVSAREQATAHLGAGHFYDRRFPDRQTSAPDLGLAELTEPRRALQAFTSDGDHFTTFGLET